MKKELEITVRVNCSYEKLHQKLIENEFKITDEYDINDIYMINKDINIDNLENLEILKKCILVRDIVGIKKILLYKNKKYALNGDIIEQGKVECLVENISDAINFMESINYKKLFKIYDKCIEYKNNQTELLVQLVNDKYIFIELESKLDDETRKFNTIDEMIKHINMYDLPYEKDNYFVKKAELVLEDTFKINKKI